MCCPALRTCRQWHSHTLPPADPAQVPQQQAAAPGETLHGLGVKQLCASSIPATEAAPINLLACSQTAAQLDCSPVFAWSKRVSCKYTQRSTASSTAAVGTRGSSACSASGQQASVLSCAGGAVQGADTAASQARRQQRAITGIAAGQPRAGTWPHTLFCHPAKAHPAGCPGPHLAFLHACRHCLCERRAGRRQHTAVRRPLPPVCRGHAHITVLALLPLPPQLLPQSVCRRRRAARAAVACIVHPPPRQLGSKLQNQRAIILLYDSCPRVSLLIQDLWGANKRGRGGVEN